MKKVMRIVGWAAGLLSLLLVAGYFWAINASISVKRHEGKREIDFAKSHFLGVNVSALEFIEIQNEMDEVVWVAKPKRGPMIWISTLMISAGRNDSCLGRDSSQCNQMDIQAKNPLVLQSGEYSVQAKQYNHYLKLPGEKVISKRFSL